MLVLSSGPEAPAPLQTPALQYENSHQGNQIIPPGGSRPPDPLDLAPPAPTSGGSLLALEAPGPGGLGGGTPQDGRGVWGAGAPQET